MEAESGIEAERIYHTRSEEETLSLGARIGEQAKAGAVYALSGDLGAGKTVFARGFARGLGIDGVICSPTFTILQLYETGRLPLYHFDVYRLETEEELIEIGSDEYLGGSGISLIEWGEKVEALLPPDTIRIRIIREGETERKIVMTLPETEKGHTEQRNDRSGT